MDRRHQIFKIEDENRYFTDFNIDWVESGGQSIETTTMTT